MTKCGSNMPCTTPNVYSSFYIKACNLLKMLIMNLITIAIFAIIIIVESINRNRMTLSGNIVIYHPCSLEHNNLYNMYVYIFIE